MSGIRYRSPLNFGCDIMCDESKSVARSMRLDPRPDIPLAHGSGTTRRTGTPGCQITGIWATNASVSSSFSRKHREGFFRAEPLDKLHRAKLHTAKLHRAKLHTAKLHRAKLHRAKLHRAKLHRAKLNRAKLHRAKL